MMSIESKRRTALSLRIEFLSSPFAVVKIGINYLTVETLVRVLCEPSRNRYYDVLKIRNEFAKSSAAAVEATRPASQPASLSLIILHLHLLLLLQRSFRLCDL